ncbi:MAG: hypothetical protein A3I01_17770 [Betaproteobacteria bacterium RIFCSPLOWO2_02_FULL_65_24]|nr:MAG: hypothetical protein A3I01_17770 [Betaproteobacteria bacterium RIFCSPLOWO2_02_FULL_65_24]OGA88540.1 MAG: hypothetical protein A3G27_19430 [Betaproteobacteria bacterium RIFCSPLOWO2_12_FULL_66_14]
MLKLKVIAIAGFGAFVLSGPLQHVGALPQTAVGDASKAVLKTARNFVIPEAFAACGNNGFGNGPLDGVPGNSGFTDLTR